MIGLSNLDLLERIDPREDREPSSAGARGLPSAPGHPARRLLRRAARWTKPTRANGSSSSRIRTHGSVTTRPRTTSGSIRRADGDAPVHAVDWHGPQPRERRRPQGPRGGRDVRHRASGPCLPHPRSRAATSPCSNVTADCDDGAWAALKERRVGDWMTLGYYIHRRLLDIAGPKMSGGVARLSPRETETLQLTASGLTSDVVAGRMGISERVVRAHCRPAATS